MGGMEELVSGAVRRGEKSKSVVVREVLLTEPDWMGEPELR